MVEAMNMTVNNGLLVTVTSNAQQVRKWAGRQRVLMRNIGGQRVPAAISCFARAGEANAHTLVITLKKRVLVIDLEAAERPAENRKAIPAKLTRVLNNAKVYAANAAETRNLLHFLGDHGIWIRDAMSGHHDLRHDANIVSTIKNGHPSFEAIVAAARECRHLYKLAKLIA